MEELKEVAWRQLGAALDMLDAAIEVCPDELWSRPAPGMGFWFLSYHTLYFLDLDFNSNTSAFCAAPFDIHQYEERAQPPPYEYPYSKAVIQEYLNHCRSKCRQAIAPEDLSARTLIGCKRIDANVFEVVLYGLRHVQHHAAQLNLLLRQETNSAPRWIRRTKQPLMDAE